MGFAPFAFEDGIDTIIAGPPSFWAVYSNENVQDARAFLRWVSGDSGQNIMVNEAGLISPFRHCSYKPKDPFYDSIADYMDADKISGWHTMLKKDGLQNVTAQVFADYAKGKMDADGFVHIMSQVCRTFYED